MDDRIVTAVGDARRVVDLGRRARAQAKLRLRQPLRALVVEGVTVDDAHAAQIADELRVKQVRFERVETTGLRVKPNFPVLAPRLGSSMPLVKKALDAGEFAELDGSRFEVKGHILEPAEVLVERLQKPGWAVVADEGVTVALDTALDGELLREGRVHDLIHQVNTMRKEAGFGLSDRIRLEIPATEADLLGYRDWIAGEVLAMSVEAAEATEVRITRA